MSPRVGAGRVPLLAGTAFGGVVMVALHVALAHSYWDYSEGVYALTSHLVRNGAGLYAPVIAAQPPGVFLAGAGLLLVHDSLEWLRLGVGLLQLGAGALAARIVWRITAAPLLTALTPTMMLLTPWAVHEHGALLPELVALPLVLGAALAVREPRLAPAAGVLCGLLPVVKLPLVLPALALLAASPPGRRRQRLLWALLTLLLAGGLATVLVGTVLWRDVVLAQAHTGTRALSALGGYWSQALWNTIGLLVGVGVLIRRRRHARDPELVVILLALVAALLLTFLTNLKQGTSLNVTVAVEAALVPAALAGAALARRASVRAELALCLAGLVFVLAQSASLLLDSHHPRPFLRPGSRPAWGVAMTASTFDTAVARARRCRVGVPYSGPPLLAFAAGRHMPADQPDQFLITHSPTFARLRAQLAGVHTCP